MNYRSHVYNKKVLQSSKQNCGSILNLQYQPQQHQNEMCSNAFTAQVMNSQALEAGFILEAKLLLTNQPVHGKCCFTIHPSYICRPIYVGIVLSVGFFSKQLPVQGLITDEYLLA